jgi:hypothetical protein
MKRILLVAFALCLVAASWGYAQNTMSATVSSPAAAVASSEITLKGDIIDNMCAGAQKPEALSAFVKTHTKQCVLTPACAASGFSIFADGKLYKFDQASNARIEEFLMKADSKLQVVVAVKKGQETLTLVSIENQK